MLLRVLRVRACHVDFPARGDEQLRTCSRADSYTNEMYWDDGLFERGTRAALRARAGGPVEPRA
jgi:hypothetical protein